MREQKFCQLQRLETNKADLAFLLMSEDLYLIQYIPQFATLE